MKNTAQKQQLWKSYDHWWQLLSNQAKVGVCAGWLMSWC